MGTEVGCGLVGFGSMVGILCGAGLTVENYRKMKKAVTISASLEKYKQELLEKYCCDNVDSFELVSGSEHSFDTDAWHSVQLQQKLGKTFVFVTHDMDEAIKLADKICIMSEGQVIQFDTPDNILRHPANDFVRDFIGQNRLIQDRPNMRTVKDAMIKPVTVHADRSLNEVVKVMRERRVDTIFVVGNSNRLLGYLDIEDINQGLRSNKELIDTMQRDIYRVRIDSKLQDSVRTILKRNVRNVPVVDKDGETLIGLVTRANLVDIVYDSIWGEIDEDENADQNAIVEPENVGADK